MAEKLTADFNKNPKCSDSETAEKKKSTKKDERWDQVAKAMVRRQLTPAGTIYW